MARQFSSSEVLQVLALPQEVRLAICLRLLPHYIHMSPVPDRSLCRKLASSYCIRVLAHSSVLTSITESNVAHYFNAHTALCGSVSGKEHLQWFNGSGMV